MSRAATIRDDLIDTIEALAVAEEFTINNFETEATQLPIDQLTALTIPKLWFVTQGGDETVKTRAKTWGGERGIQMILKRSVDLSDTTECDQLETLLDELKQVCRDHGGSSSLVFNGTTYRFRYHSIRIEPLRDPAGTPYSYGIIHDVGVFEGVFTNIYALDSE